MARLTALAVTVVLAVVAVVLPAAVVVTAGPLHVEQRDVGLVALVLATVDRPESHPETLAIRTALEAHGMRYELVNVRAAYPTGKEALRLEEPKNKAGDPGLRGRYYVVVLATRDLAYESSPGFWSSGLSRAQWDQLSAYQARYGVRVISLHSWPYFDGVMPAMDMAVAQAELESWAENDQSDDGAGVTLHPDHIVAKFTDEGLAVDETIPTSITVSTKGSWVTPASLRGVTGKSSADAALAGSVFTEMATFFDDRKGFESALSMGTAAAVQSKWGVETWHFFFTPSAFHASHAASLGAALQWATRGVYIGKRRVVLGAIVDDVFLTTDEWEGPGKATHTVRMSADDLRGLADFQDRLSAALPTGSDSFRFGMAFNGLGVENAGGAAADGLAVAASDKAQNFRWTSHTYNHPELTDSSFSECQTEASENADLADVLWGEGNWAKEAMVTPAITGLSNGQCLSALASQGIRAVVGDNSRPELVNQETVYHGLWSSTTTPAGNPYSDMFIVPRFSTNIYFDNSKPDTNTAHFHHLTGYSWDFAGLLDYEAGVTARNLLQLRSDPYMFHQTNAVLFQPADYMSDAMGAVPAPSPGDAVQAAAFDAQGRTSLLALWTAAAVSHTLRYTTLPLRNLGLPQLADEYQAREAHDACNAHATLRVVNGVFDSVVVERRNGASPSSCKSLAITGVTPVAGQHTTAPTSTEVYGPDVTTTIDVSTITGGDRAELRTSLAPVTSGCPSGCSGHGACSQASSKCSCATGYHGEACELAVTEWGKNFCPNPSFEEAGHSEGLVNAWFPYRSGYTVTKVGGEAHDGVTALRVSASPSNNGKGKGKGKAHSGGALVYVELQQTSPRAIRVSGFSKAHGVSGPPSSEYSVYCDIVYDNGNRENGLAANFDPAIKGWQRAELTFLPQRPIKAVWLYALFQAQDDGEVLFDTFKVQEALDVPANGGGDDDDGAASNDDSSSGSSSSDTGSSDSGSSSSSDSGSSSSSSSGSGSDDGRPVSLDMRCGKFSEVNAVCPTGLCCNLHGWCGMDKTYCSANSGGDSNDGSGSGDSSSSGGGSSSSSGSSTGGSGDSSDDSSQPIPMCAACTAGTSGPCKVDGSSNCVSFVKLGGVSVCPVGAAKCTQFSHDLRVTALLNLVGLSRETFPIPDRLVFTDVLAAAIAATGGKAAGVTAADVKIEAVTTVSMDLSDPSGGDGGVPVLLSPAARRLPTGTLLSSTRSGGSSVSDYTSVAASVALVVLVPSDEAASAVSTALRLIVADGSLRDALAAAGIEARPALVGSPSVPTKQVSSQPSSQGISDGEGSTVPEEESGLSGAWVWVVVVGGVVAAALAVALFMRMRRIQRDGGSGSGSSALSRGVSRLRLTLSSRGESRVEMFNPHDAEEEEYGQSSKQDATRRPVLSGVRRLLSKMSLRGGANDNGARRGDDDGDSVGSDSTVHQVVVDMENGWTQRAQSVRHNSSDDEEGDRDGADGVSQSRALGELSAQVPAELATVSTALMSSTDNMDVEIAEAQSSAAHAAPSLAEEGEVRVADAKDGEDGRPQSHRSHRSHGSHRSHRSSRSSRSHKSRSRSRHSRHSGHRSLSSRHSSRSRRSNNEDEGRRRADGEPEDAGARSWSERYTAQPTFDNTSLYEADGSPRAAAGAAAPAASSVGDGASDAGGSWGGVTATRTVTVAGTERGSVLSSPPATPPHMTMGGITGITSASSRPGTAGTSVSSAVRSSSRTSVSTGRHERRGTSNNSVFAVAGGPATTVDLADSAEE